VQAAVKPVQMMIALGPGLAQTGFEFLAGQNRFGAAHKQISMPS
jgi:hypothetical protein